MKKLGIFFILFGLIVGIVFLHSFVLGIIMILCGIGIASRAD